MPAARAAALAAAALLAACGSSRPTDSARTEPLGEPADAGVSVGRPSGGHTGPELPPTVVKGSVLEKHRLTGNPQIEPDPADLSQLGGKSATGVVKLCVDTAGKVSTVQVLRSSGLPGYDAKIEREVKTWTFRPVMGEGQPVDVCTVMIFIHRPSSSPPPP